MEKEMVNQLALVICQLAMENHAPIIPVDSEHSAIFQSLVGEDDNEIEKIDSQCILSDTGVDLTESVSMTLSGGIMANIQSSAGCGGYNTGVLAGSKGNIVVDNVNNPHVIRVYALGGVLKEEITVPECITGYEYEFLACRDAIGAGLIEPPQMPHAEILRIMEIMDSLRKDWGVKFPME